MHSEDFENELLLYFYGELEKERLGRFSKHLENCKVCKVRLEELKNFSLFTRQNQKSPPQQVLNEIYNGIRQTKKNRVFANFKSIFSRKFYKPAIAFAGAVLIVVVFNVFKKPPIPKDLWFDDLYLQIENLNSDISKVDEYFASSDYIINTKIDDLEEMVGSVEITDI
jgi:hypothetical protein